MKDFLLSGTFLIVFSAEAMASNNDTIFLHCAGERRMSAEADSPRYTDFLNIPIAKDGSWIDSPDVKRNNNGGIVWHYKPNQILDIEFSRLTMKLIQTVTAYGKEIQRNSYSCFPVENPFSSQ